MDKEKAPAYKIALLGDSSTQLLAKALKQQLKKSGIQFDFYESDYNQIDQQILDPSSELYEFSPNFIILFQNAHKLLRKFYSKPENQKNFSETELELTNQLIYQLETNFNAKIIWSNYSEVNDGVYGNYSNKTNLSFLYHLRKINLELMHLAQSHPSLFINDLSLIQNESGTDTFFDTRLYVNADLVYSTEILTRIAKNTCQILLTITGKFNKCLILDLDNTLWGGIIGDDGLEKIQVGELGIGKAFTEIQIWAKALKNRGIILAVCSKNEEIIAKEPFEKHPEMVLRLDDIAVFVANWENKADNIRLIQSILNIGFDSMVFLDDNPFERNMVRENIPGITVPELPEDPADYLKYLHSLNLFETASFSNEDSERTKLYQVEANRNIFQKSFTDENSFLKNLKMIALVEPFNKFNTPRVAQLSQRSNQFNLRTIRYTETDIARFSDSKEYITLAFTLKDKFGDNGLIAVIILKKEDKNTLFIDTWIMSCRVLKRGMENFTLNVIAETAQKNGYSFIKGEYIPTAKNGMVKDHYSNLGFEQTSGNWILNLTNYKSKKCFINIE